MRQHGLSDRSAAAVASSVLEDVGLISPEDTSHVIDRCKVRRERKKNRCNMQLQGNLSDVQLCGLYFDGRKDHTIVQVKIGEKHYRQTVVEEHVTLVQEQNASTSGT